MKQYLLLFAIYYKKKNICKIKIINKYVNEQKI